MKTFFTCFILLFCLSCFINTACKDVCKPCNYGAECVDGGCRCEPERFWFNSNCVFLDENSYIATNAACYCYDTLAMTISGEGENRLFSMPVKSGQNVGNQTQNVFYYESSEGDSLYSPELALRCFNTDDVPLKPAVYGKKQPDGSWKLKLVFRNALTWEKLDSCTLHLKKFR